MQCKSYSHSFSKKFQHICVSFDVNFNESLTNDIVSFEQLGPVFLVKNSKKFSGLNSDDSFTMADSNLYSLGMGWSGVVKVSSIVSHWGVQLVLAYSWARPANLVAGKVEGECFYFFCFFSFITVPLSTLSFSFI